MGSIADQRIVSVPPDRSDAPQVSLPLASELRIEQFLLGRSRAVGVFQDFTGRIRRRFAVQLDGRFNDGVLVLSEDFLFDDGVSERRLWRIMPRSGQYYTASCDDMIGDARGKVSGAVLRWSYQFVLKLGARRLRVRFHDTFIQMADDMVLNSARITKFGFELGRVTTIFQREC